MASSNADSMLGAAAERQEALAVPEMGAAPRRKVAVLACMDTRLDLLPLLGVERGDAHTIRNAGGLVTDDALRSLAISQRKLGTEEIVVLMHDRCGLLGGSDDEFARELEADGAGAEWKLGAFSDVEEELASGLARLRSAPALIHRDRVRGFVFDPDAGTLREVAPLSSADDDS